ncbi:MAG TPA: M43 family zinc metalloprotease [Bacteroidia bacterium]
MNTITKLITAGTLSICIFSTAYAQDPKFCGTTEMMQKALNADPALKQQYLAEEKVLDEQDKVGFANGYKEKDRSMLPIYTIPVVFHILHEGGTENISDAQILDQMRILNEDYRKLNADISTVVPAFTSIAADCEIQFRLAQKDPNGNCTNGIDRIYSSETNVGDDGSKLNAWPRNMYINIWVVKTITSGAAGYAYLPGTTAAANDGIIILSTYVGSIGTGAPGRSRALTHEIGHHLNLNHTWGGTNNPGVDCTGSDAVTDTPKTIGWTVCNLSGASCGSTLDNVQNYMDYSYCSNMFTTGQKTRMRNVLTSTSGFSSVAQRYNLWTPANLTATGISTPAVLCLADFQSNDLDNSICQGDSVSFTDLSWNGDPTSWSWTFAGGTPSTSADSVPMITYNTPGTYEVTLVVSNGSGSVNATKTNYITVYPNVATYAASVYSESFEGSAVPNTDWHVNNLNSGTNTWTQTSTAAATGSKSVRIVNASTYDANVDELISPPIDLTMIAGVPSLTYKVAHAQKTSTSADKLQIYISTNCGQSWALRQTVVGSALSTGGVVSSSFVPTASQWITKTVSLASYSSATSALFKFKFTSDAGNNVYLDDINILGNVGIDELSSTINFSVYPNPAEDNTIVSFSLTDNQQTSLKVYDVVGREVSSLYQGNLGAGEHHYSLAENAALSAGAYFIKLTVGKESFTQKLIVK